MCRNAHAFESLEQTLPVFADSLAAIKTCLFIGNAGEPANQCENGAELFSGVKH
jgi:hypothetical protein